MEMAKYSEFSNPTNIEELEADIIVNPFKYKLTPEQYDRLLDGVSILKIDPELAKKYEKTPEVKK